MNNSLDILRKRAKITVDEMAKKTGIPMYDLSLMLKDMSLAQPKDISIILFFLVHKFTKGE